MGLQRYRADEAETDTNGAIAYYARSWMGRTLAKVKNCPTPIGTRTVYATGEPDTFFSIPAACKWKDRTVRGFLTYTDGNWSFIAYRNSWIYPYVG